MISGGDAYQLAPQNITLIGDALLAIPHVRRMRFATKGLAVMPMKILTDPAWVDALVRRRRARPRAGQRSRRPHALQPPERNLGDHAARAVAVLFERGVYVRNQTVLMRGVNDDAATMLRSSSGSSTSTSIPYYVYMHDLVSGVEDLRTSVQTAIDIEKAVRGATAGYNTPTFICDAPGGGGKRDVHSFE